MGDLARLLVAPLVVAAPLVARQQDQRLGGDAGVIGDGFERRDDAVAAEETDEPGHSGGEEDLAALARREHL